MAPIPLDPEIRAAVGELNRLAGVATRASCQGKAAPSESSTHADVAYVLFGRPLPIAFEERLVDRLGDVARVDPESLYCRWPARNREFRVRLLDAAVGLRHEREAEPWLESSRPLAMILPAIERLLSDTGTGAFVWCFDCDLRVEGEPHAPPCRAVRLIQGGEGVRLDLFRQFLETDERPIDAKLRRREPDSKLLERTLRGDFGPGHRRAWQTFVSASACRALERDARERVSTARAAGARIDLYFKGRSVTFARR